MVIFILVIFLLWACLLLFVITSAFLGFVATRVPFVPTPTQDIKKLVKDLPVRKEDVVYDLGSGDGKVVFLIEKFSGAKTRGYEMTRWTHYLALIKKKIKKSQAEFKKENFFNVSWGEASIIYCYLYPPLMGHIEQKAQEDLKPGSFLVSRDFPLPNKKPEQVWYQPNDHELYIYKY